MFGGVDDEAAVTHRFGAGFSVQQCRTEADTVEAVIGADLAFVNFAPITEKSLSALDRGATVIRSGIGVDNIDPWPTSSSAGWPISAKLPRQPPLVSGRHRRDHRGGGVAGRRPRCGSRQLSQVGHRKARALPRASPATE